MDPITQEKLEVKNNDENKLRLENLFEYNIMVIQDMIDKNKQVYNDNITGELHNVKYILAHTTKQLELMLKVYNNTKKSIR